MPFYQNHQPPVSTYKRQEIEGRWPPRMNPEDTLDQTWLLELGHFGYPSRA